MPSRPPARAARTRARISAHDGQPRQSAHPNLAARALAWCLHPFFSLLRPTLSRLFLPPVQWHAQVYAHVDELAIDILARNGLPVHLLPPTFRASAPPRYEVIWPDALLWFVAPEGLLVELADGTRLVHDTTQRTAGGRVETMLRYLHTYDPRFDSGVHSLATLAHLIERDSGGPVPTRQRQRMERAGGTAAHTTIPGAALPARRQSA